MVLEIKIKNFRSFKTEQILSFEASSDTDNEEYYVVKIGKHRVLKNAVIFGANASGKTNIIHAFYFIKEITTNPRYDKTQSTSHLPFLFDNEYVYSPGEFEITFFINDTKYHYKIILDSEIIYQEKLNVYLSSKPTMVFSRIYDKNKKISNFKANTKFYSDSDEILKLKANLINNTTVIAAFAKSNIDFAELEKVYNYFSTVWMPVIASKTELFNYSLDYYDKNYNDEYYSFIIDFLKKADYNIEHLELEKVEIPSDDIIKIADNPMIPNALKNQMFQSNKKFIRKNLLFKHNINNEINSRQFPVDLESLGTKRMFGFTAPLYELLKHNKFLTIDEIDSSLHPDLIEFILKVFVVNSQRSQLIFNTHNINLLNNKDLIRKDIVWFTEKQADGSTDLYSLDDFNIRKELSYFNAYKLGKIGALPQIGSSNMGEI